MISESSTICPVCGESVPDNARECPVCQAELTLPVVERPIEQPVEALKPEKRILHPWRSVGKRAARIAAEKGAMQKMKKVGKSLDEGEFEEAVRSYQAARKHVPQLKHGQLIASLLDLLEKSVGIIVRLKKISVPATQSSVKQETARRRPSTAGRLALLSVYIFAGIGLLNLFGVSLTGLWAGATFTQDAGTPTDKPTLPPTLTPVPTSPPELVPINNSNIDDVKELGNWLAGDEINSLSFSPNGKLLASGNGGNEVTVWNLEIASASEKFSVKGSYCAFSPDGKWVGVAGVNGVHIYRVSDGGLERAFDESRAYYSVAFSPDSQTIVAGSDNNFYIWSVIGDIKQKLGGDLNGEIHSLSFSQDGHLLAVASNVNSYVWNLQDQKLKRSGLLPKQSLVYYSVATDADGEWYAFGLDNGQVYTLWMSNGKTRMSGNDNGHSVHGLQFLHGGNFPEILVSGDDVNLTFWIMTGNEVAQYSKYVTVPILSLSIAPDNKLIATGSADGVIHLWGVLR